jgi:hypothetical protein
LKKDEVFGSCSCCAGPLGPPDHGSRSTGRPSWKCPRICPGSIWTFGFSRRSPKNQHDNHHHHNHRGYNNPDNNHNNNGSNYDTNSINYDTNSINYVSKWTLK